MIKTILEIEDILDKAGLGWTLTYIPENHSYVIAIRDSNQ